MQMRILALGFLASAGGASRHQVLARTGEHLRHMLVAARTRRLLSQMDEHMLRDIGISRTQARAEAARWPWDLAPR
jgi:uncharacterized protein YjiS (DUF1127 family)